jgi:hypothetical protein
MKKIELIFKVCADSPQSFTVTALERFFDECLSANIRLTTAKKFVESLSNLNEYTKNAIERTYKLFLEDEQQKEN